MIGTPPSPDQASFTATVTNSTHYDLQIGFIQTMDSLQASNTYTDGSFQSVAGSSLLDSTQTDLVWYSPNSYGRVNAGGNATITSSDSPGTYQPLVKTAGPPVVGLTLLKLSGQYQTNVVVYGGWNGWQSNAPAVPGVPIALSTAAWHVYGKATAPFTAPPTLGAGSGPMPATLPGPNAAWTSTGDGVAKYLSWNGNAKALLNSGGISRVVLATASEEAGVSVPRVAWAGAFDEAARSGRRIAGPDGSRSRSLASRPAPFFLRSRSSIPPVVNASSRNLPVVASLRPRRVHALNADVLPSGGE
jgi:hypothetical protein